MHLSTLWNFAELSGLSFNYRGSCFWVFLQYWVTARFNPWQFSTLSCPLKVHRKREGFNIKSKRIGNSINLPHFKWTRRWNEISKQKVQIVKNKQKEKSSTKKVFTLKVKPRVKHSFNKPEAQVLVDTAGTEPEDREDPKHTHTGCL